jgi:hypothetical protein
MMILGYLIGRKYYPIPYNLKKFFGYLGLTILLYFVSRWIQPENIVLSIGFSFLLLMVFIGTVWVVERPRLLKWS